MGDMLKKGLRWLAGKARVVVGHLWEEAKHDAVDFAFYFTGVLVWGFIRWLGGALRGAAA